jgi:hypothetical protein
MKPKLRVTWIDSGLEPQCAPNPRYPHGIGLDFRHDVDAPCCTTDLPYPAKRCGAFIIKCQICGLSVAISTAGRPDDPRSIIVSCKLH